MKHIFTTTASVLLIFIGVLVISGCASTTVIESYPSGAKLYINGEVVGITPYTYTDTKIVGSSNFVTLEKEGYQTMKTVFARNEEVDPGAIIGGVFLWVPFLWTMKYKPTHSYELILENGRVENSANINKSADIKSKAFQLRELKNLLDEKVITQDEFDKEKKKILEEK